jgi:polyisoprenoid-binding protein YceI
MSPSARLVRRPGVARRLALGASLAVALAGSAAAEPRRFAIQPEASEVTFYATSRLMNANGRFHRLGGEVVVDPRDPATARISLSIEAASIDTGIGMRDNHLRGPDFFDTPRFPAITFESLRVEATGRHATVTGRLTLHGVAREITVPVDVSLSEVAMVASGEFVLNRGDYGMTYNSFLNPVGNEVRVSFAFRARAS